MGDSDRERSSLDQVREFCADTTAHGLARAAAAKSWPARLFWIAIFIFAATFSVWQISRSVEAYFEYRTKTEVFLVSKERLRFPAVTVCNINPFKLSKIENTPVWKSVATSRKHDSFDSIKEALMTNVLVNITDSFNNDAWKMGNLGDELIALRRFPGNNSHLYCSHKNFSHYFDMIYGNCFTFNGSSSRVTEPGHRQGFQMNLFINANEYTGMLAESVGALVSIHSPYVEPVIDENSIFVAPGSAIYVSLHVQNVSLLGHPFNGGNCTNNISYSQMSCLRNCIASKMRSRCGCSSVVLRQQPLCDPFNEKQAKCLDDVKQNQDFRNCSCDPPCNRLHYLHTVSNSVWPSKSHMPGLLKVLERKENIGKLVTNLDSARENLARLNIHFASLEVTNIEQSPAITDGTLMGDIGGQLGLFIGVSCITLVEFLDLLWRLVFPRKKTMSNQVRAFEGTER
ncbi:bile acid-sensitive ion channel-like [Oculina patagonica]